MAVNITADPATLQAGQEQQAQVDAQNPQQPQVALSNANDSSNGVSVANQAPAYGDPGQPKAPAAPVSQAHMHTGIFHTLLSRMNQGDQQVIRDKNGNPVAGPDGKPQTRPMDSKQMGRSILAGVLSAMATSEQHQPYRNGNGIWVNPQNEAVQAGQQAFQQGRPQAQYKQADAQLAQQRTQQYAVYKSNVDMYKMAHEIAHMKADDKTAAVQAFSGTYDMAEDGQIPGYNSETGDLSENEAETQLKSLDPTTHMMVPNGKTVPVLDPQGNPTGETEIHWMILPGQKGQIPLTKEMIADHPELKGAAEGKTIPLTQWMRLVRGQASKQVINSMVTDLAGTLTGDDPKAEVPKFDYNKFVKDSKATPDQISQLGNLSAVRNDPVAFAKGLQQIDKTGNIDNALRQQGIKIDAAAWARKQSVNEADEKAQNARKEKQQDLLTAPLTDSLAEDIQAEYESARDHNGIPDARYAAAAAFSQNKANRKAAGEQTAADIKKNAEVDREGLDGAADAIVNGGSLGKMSEYAAMGRSPAKTYLGNAIRKAAIAAGKDPQFYSPGPMEQRAKTYADFTSDKNGSVGSNIVAFDNYLGHTNEAMDAAERLKGQTVRHILGQVPILNQPLSWLNKNLVNNEDYNRFQAALVPVKKEFEAFLNNNRAEHTEDLQEMSKLLNDTKQSPQQIIDHLKEMTKSADVRLAGLGRKFQSTMHQNFDDLVTPQGAAVMKRMGVDSLAMRGNASYKPPQGNRSTPPPPPPGFGPVQQQQQQQPQ